MVKQRRLSLKLDDHIPESVRDLMEKISSVDNNPMFMLIGFGENMKWLSRLLANKGIAFCLADWREEFVKYDCGGNIVISLTEMIADYLVICADSNAEQMMAMEFLIKNEMLGTPVINASREGLVLLNDLHPFDKIYARSRQRVGKQSHDITALGNVVQCVYQTRHLRTPMVEFGVFNGGTASLIYETERQQIRNPRHLILFDTFSGIPPVLGIDTYWEKSFSNNSESEVRKRFWDAKSVEIVPGDILDNLDKIPEILSFVHIDVDTYSVTSKLLPIVWDALSFGGIVLFDDYGFFPNCMAATVAINQFFDGLDGAFFYVLPNNGCFVLKQ